MERLNIVVVGPGASGKDFFRKNLLSLGYKPSISYTTRPPREGEEDSIDYHFVCKEDFVNMIGDSFFYEWNYFAKSWYYGTPKSAFDGRYNLVIIASLSHSPVATKPTVEIVLFKFSGSTV